MVRNFKKRIAVTAVLVLTSLHLLQAQEVWVNVAGGLGDNSDPTQYVNALLDDTVNKVLYAAGTFKVINNKTEKVNGIAYWDEEKWQSNAPTPTGGKFTGEAYCLAQYRGKIYAGFRNGEVKYYDGTGWQLAGDFNGKVKCMVVYKDKLYVGGEFANIGSVKTNFIACYDGATWSAVKKGFTWVAGGGGVEALHVWKDKLYAGGAFDSDGTTQFNGIASWNDTTWSVLGKGVNTENDLYAHLGWVNAIQGINDDLYVGGKFDTAGDVTVNYIARWDGNNWYDVAGGTNGEVLCMVAKDSDLYVGGGFGNAGGVTNSACVAKWDGKQWFNVGNGLSNGVGGSFNSFSLYNNELYGGGSFSGNNSGYYLLSIAKLVIITNDNLLKTYRDDWVWVYPNPSANEITVQVKSGQAESFEISNLLGEVMKCQVSSIWNQDKKEIDVSNLPQGIYLLRVKTKQGWQVGKFVKE